MNFNLNVNENVLKTSGSRANKDFAVGPVQTEGEEMAAASIRNAGRRIESALRGKALAENLSERECAQGLPNLLGGW